MAGTARVLSRKSLRTPRATPPSGRQSTGRRSTHHPSEKEWQTPPFASLQTVASRSDPPGPAYVNGWIDPVNRIGDLGPVGARPAYRRQGLTRAVLLECLRRMKARGMDRVCVSTGVSNTPALRLYESVGFKTVNTYLEYVKTG